MGEESKNNKQYFCKIEEVQVSKQTSPILCVYERKKSQRSKKIPSIHYTLPVQLHRCDGDVALCSRGTRVILLQFSSYEDFAFCRESLAVIIAHQDGTSVPLKHLMYFQYHKQD